MQMKIILSFLTLLSLAFLVPSDVFGAWYDTEWEYRNKITVSLNSVISNDLSDFPVLIKFTTMILNKQMKVRDVILFLLCPMEQQNYLMK